MQAADQLITSRQNDMVKHVRSLQEKKNRDREGLFLIEGAKAIKEALASGCLPWRLFMTEKAEAQEGTGSILPLLDKCPVIRVNDQVMAHMSETRAPQGIIAVLKMPDPVLDEIIVDDASLILIVDGIQDPGNFGTIIRTADAFGAKAVISTPGTADLYNGKTLRSTMGSLFHLPVVREADPGDLSDFLQKNKIHTLAAHLDSAALQLTDLELPRPLAIVLGNEGAGVSEQMLEMCQGKVKIPMVGQAESLNVATSAAVILYEAFRQYAHNPNETCK